MADYSEMLRNAGLEFLFAPQIIDENNNMSAGYTPSFNEQGLLLDPRSGSAVDTDTGSGGAAQTPYYKKGDNGNAWAFDKSGNWIDSGQKFNDVEAKFGPIAALQGDLGQFFVMSAGAYFGAQALGGLADAAASYFTDGSGVLDPASAYGMGGTDAGIAGGQAADTAAAATQTGAETVAAEAGTDTLAGGAGGAGTDTLAAETGADLSSNVDYVNSFDSGAMAGGGESGAGIIDPVTEAVSAPNAAAQITKDLVGTAGPEGAPMTAADVAGLTGEAAPTQSQGLIGNVMDWVKENKQLATGIATAGLGALGGAAKSMLDADTMERKAELDLKNKQDLATFYRQFIQSSSAGGAGVKLGFRAPAQARQLRRADGSLVYGPKGLITRAQQ